MLTYYNGNPNFPTPPRNISNDYMTFPNDLITDSRQFYCDINFVEYKFAMQLTGTALPQIVPAGGMKLPIPKKLNDVQTLVWGEYEALRELAPTAYKLSGYQSIVSGETLNPMLFMQFQRPNYKEFVLSWTFTPNNEQESRTVRRIVEMFKYRSLPRQVKGGLVLEYPDIALLKLYPDDTFTFKFRPCAVMSVNVDYTGAGMPSFFKNGAPTVVNLNVQLKEIQLWDKTNYDGGKGIGNIENFEKGIKYLQETPLKQGFKDVVNGLQNIFGGK